MHTDASMHAHHHEHAHHHHEHDATPRQELIAMLRYMADHNAAHTKELAELAAQLDTAGEHAQYEQVMQAVAEFERANARLRDVLRNLE